jgi:hypothetical protein
VAAQALEQSQLESKDKDQLLAIAKALGLKASSRNKKADIITQILEMTAAPATPASPAPSAPESSPAGSSGPAVTEPQPRGRGTSSRGSAASSRSASAPDTLPLEVAATDTLPLEAEPPADWEREFEAAESEAQESTGTAATSTSVDGSGTDRLGNGGRSGTDPCPFTQRLSTDRRRPAWPPPRTL